MDRLAAQNRIFTFKFLLLTAIVTISCFGWEQFEPALKMAQPNADGIYEFDMLIEHKLTMSTRRNGNGEMVLMDYVPDDVGELEGVGGGRWQIRDGRNGTTIGDNAGGGDDQQVIMADLLQLDGRHGRVVTINGQSPGRVLVVSLGARVAMRVRNRLPTEALTIHLHGMHKKHAWWTDGVAFVQQCPIHPGQDFVYRFIADTPGTHWYHGHLMNDRADGLLGGFVVVKQGGGNSQQQQIIDDNDDGQQQPPANVGREYFTILQDWSSVGSQEQWLCQYHNTMKWLYGFDEPAGNGARRKCWAPKRTYDATNVGGSVPLSAILVGEKGWYSQEDIRQRPSQLPLSTFAIKRGENVLLRLVNGGISQGFMLWIEGHDDVWVMAADGVGVKPRRIDALILFPGERYDLLIRGLDTPRRREYWLIIETMEAINWDWTPGKPQLGLAKLHYEDFEGSGGKEEVEEANKVDWTHAKCTSERKCLVLNCPFAQFAVNLNLSCLSAHLLESAKPVQDQELLEQKNFPDGKFHEVFANMHADNHFDGWMFLMPKGIPYFHEQHLDRIARQCDPTKCDPEHSAHWEPGCQCFVHFNFTLGNVVQITIYNMGDMANTHGMGYSHPLHLHGTHFLLMKVGYGGYHAENGSIWTMNADIPCHDPNSRCVGLHWSNEEWLDGNVPGMQPSPSWRDTVNIPVGGYITIRFRASNPGWWFAHCHLMLHNMGGTGFAFRIGSYEELPKPPASYPHSCGIPPAKEGEERSIGGGVK